jgi:hypothetical protein
MHLKKFNKSYIIIYKLSIIFHKIIKKNLILNITSKSLKNIYFFNPKNDSTTIVYQFAHHYLSQRNEAGGQTFNLINLDFTRLKNLLLTQKKKKKLVVLSNVSGPKLEEEPKLRGRALCLGIVCILVSLHIQIVLIFI